MRLGMAWHGLPDVHAVNDKGCRQVAPRLRESPLLGSIDPVMTAGAVEINHGRHRAGNLAQRRGTFRAAHGGLRAQGGATVWQPKT